MILSRDGLLNVQLCNFTNKISSLFCCHCLKGVMNYLSYETKKIGWRSCVIKWNNTTISAEIRSSQASAGHLHVVPLCTYVGQ